MFAAIYHRLRGGSAQRNRLVRDYQRELYDFLKSDEQLVFTPADKPVISIIIPVFNKAYHTLRCLRSLSQHREVATEIIIFDNASSDETTDLLKRIKHIKIIRSEENLGFIGANNEAAKQANGDYLLLMNNDATILEGRLSHLTWLFERDKNIGAIGARIKFATGRAQEAGSIIFNDGSTDGFLRNGDVMAPSALFARDVDYCSGVFLMLKRLQFLQMGGLDMAFAPAYYEETDLCMRLRQEGLRVVYTPRLLIEHFEFGSQPSQSGRDAIATRKKIFLQKWRDTLERENYCPPKTPASIAARRLLSPRRLLIITDDFYSNECRRLTAEALNHHWHISLYNPGTVMIDWPSACAKLDERIELISAREAANLPEIFKKLPGFFTHISGMGKNAEQHLGKYRQKKPKFFTNLTVLPLAELQQLLKAP